MPMMKPGQKVTIKYKGKMACGFVTVVRQKPISRYVVTVVRPPWDFATPQEFTDAMVARLNEPNGPCVWGYVYKRRDELEASVFGVSNTRASSAVQ